MRLLIFATAIMFSSAAFACSSVDGLPDKACTPGSTDPRVTQENIHQTICVPGYSAKVRPPVEVTNPMKRQVMQEYGLAGQDARLYEGDHEVSIELAGCPGPGIGCDFHANYWPQIWVGADGARAKDVVENRCHKAVCSGRIPLATAQNEIATNWKAACQ